MISGPLSPEHLFLNICDIKEQLTLEEIQSKLTDIMSRLSFAYRMGNQAMINQLEMIRETYTRAHKEKLEEMFSDDKNSDKITGKIDIS